MSELIESEFWDRADALIHVANDQCKEAPNSKVSSSMLYAAARFNAFIVAVGARDLDELNADKEAATAYFTEQYRKMFVENLDDYIDNYAKYVASDSQA